MGDQQRFFGRWLMPIFPIVAILAAYGAVELVRWLARTRRVPVVIGGTVVTVVLLAQSVVAVIHNDAVLSRPDTRNLTRNWMVAHVPAGAKVVIEPVVPDNWAADIGRSLSATPSGERWVRYPTSLSNVDNQRQPAARRPAPLRGRRPVRTDAAARASRRVRAAGLLLDGRSARCRPAVRSPSRRTRRAPSRTTRRSPTGPSSSTT